MAIPGSVHLLHKISQKHDELGLSNNSNICRPIIFNTYLRFKIKPSGELTPRFLTKFEHPVFRSSSHIKKIDYFPAIFTYFFAQLDAGNWGTLGFLVAKSQIDSESDNGHSR